MKRFSTLLMVLCLILSVLPFPAGAAEGSAPANSWRYTDGELTASLDMQPLMASASHPDSTLTGIDVSHHQGKIDWEAVKKSGKVDFVIIRCGYGMDQTDQDDTCFEYNASECERLGIPYGVYIYSYATDTQRAQSEAEHVLRLINGHQLSYPVYFDMEDDTTIEADHAAIASTFCSQIAAAGYPVGVYANWYWWDTYLTDACFDNWHRWVAHYNSTCGYSGNYAMWQYSDSGSVSGINGKVDMNYLIGSPTDHGTAVTHHTYEAALTAPTCTGQGFSTHTCTICGNSYAANATASLGHSYENAELVFDEETKTHFAICSRCGAACGILRISGQNRYATSFAIADTMKQTLGTEKFDTIIVASGTGFADALSGSYLAAVKNAPILISDGKNSADLAVYIRENLSSGGRVYLLGGTGVLSENLENALKAECSDVKRLRGSTRYETNLAILQEAGIGAADVLICTGTGFADSLSASAAGKPILLVSGALTDAQKEFLNTNCQGSTFHIIGGTGAVSSGIEETLRSGGHTVKRIGGSSRYETSAMVARQFFDDPSSAILAYSMNFPDGLCGGALAHAMGAPMLLTAQNQESVPASYVSDHGITTGYILGGSAAVSDATAGVVFGMGSNTVIPKK